MENLPELIRRLYENLIESPGKPNQLESTERIDLGEEVVPEYTENGGYRMVRVPKNEPYIKIKVNGTEATLAFIHGGGEEPYTFKNLLDGFLCWASSTGKTRVDLQDNALFSIGDCKFNALLFRAFKGDLGLYAKRGWYPVGGVDELNAHVAIIRSFPKGGVVHFRDLIQKSPELKEALDSIEEDDESPLGPWLLGLPCPIYSEFFNRLDQLGSAAIKNEANPIVPDEPTQKFLVAVGKYTKANGKLMREPVCPVPAPAEGGRRRSSRKTQRRKHKRRNARASRRHPKRTHKSRR
jgi:hypothetical protein